MQRRGLIVDDEQVVCELIGKVLHSAGMEALTLTRSSEAPEILDEGKFDMVFLDLHMASPDVSMSGILVRASRVVPVGSSLRMSLQLSQRMRPIMASGSVVRILGGNQMGIQLHQLTVPDSERLQEFLLPLIPAE
jgi:CheY-like chemotaxis protein